MGTNQMVIRDIPPGTLSIYPQGLMHLQVGPSSASLVPAEPPQPACC